MTPEEPAVNTPNARVHNPTCNDDVVLAHARGMRPGYGGVLTGDVRDLDAIFGNPGLRGLLDVDDRMIVVLAAVLHFLPDEHAYQVVRGLRRRLAPGSVLVMSHATSSAADERRVQGMERAYDNATSALRFRAEEEIRALAGGWEVVDPPGLCDVATWGLPDPHRGQVGEHVRVVGLVAVLPGGVR